MNIRKWIVMGCALLSATAAWPIGRSGNGKIIGDEDGFEAMAPRAYAVPRELGAGNLRLSAPGGTVTTSRQDTSIDFIRLVNALPEAKGLTRSEFVQKLTTNGWTSATSYDECVEVFRREDATSISIIAAWGDEKGVLIWAPTSNLAKRSIDALIPTLVIDIGACAWK